MLDRQEIARRIKAARELRNIGQTELAKLLAADGLGIHDVGRIERGELEMQRIHREALQRHLGIPERWLTAATVDEIVGLGPDEAAPSNGRVQPASAEELLDELKDATRIAELLLSRLGQSVGRRGLQSRRAGDRRRESPSTAA